MYDINNTLKPKSKIASFNEINTGCGYGIALNNDGYMDECADELFDVNKMMLYLFPEDPIWDYKKEGYSESDAFSNIVDEFIEKFDKNNVSQYVFASHNSPDSCVTFFFWPLRFPWSKLYRAVNSEEEVYIEMYNLLLPYLKEGVTIDQFKEKMQYIYN